MNLFDQPTWTVWLSGAAAAFALALPLTSVAQSAPATSADAPPRAAVRTPIAVDRIAAVVNNEVITARELEQRVDLFEAQLRRRNTAMPSREVLERQVLERMIVDRAQAQLARELGIRIDDQTVDRGLARIAEQNGMTLTEFRDRIERDGIPFSRFRSDMRNEILQVRLREREIDAKVQVSDAEVDAFLAEQGSAGGTPSEYLVSHILVRVPENASPEQIDARRVRAEEVVRQLAAGADFAQLAATYSDAPEGLSEGGSLGWRSPERLPPLFVEAVSKVKPGTVAPIVRSPNGFHVLKLVEQRAPQGSVLGGPVVQTRARHILIRVNELVSEAEAQRRLNEIRQRIEAGTTDFADMARQYSADGSAGRGGDLGWVYAGDTVPEFERALNALKPGQISQPVRTPFGYHLIQVQERRTDEASPERTRQLARQAVRERKIEEAHQDWLRQLRDRTYVELRAE